MPDVAAHPYKVGFLGIHFGLAIESRLVHIQGLESGLRDVRIC